MRAARKWSSRRHRANRSSKILGSDSRDSISSLRFMDDLALCCWRHLGATRTASRPEGPITPLIWMMTTNNDCFPMLLARTLYQGSADSHSGISNGGSARDCYETLCSDPAHRWCNFRVAKNYRPNLFEPCFSAKRPKIKQFGR